MQKNTSAQTDEGANASTNQSRRDAHTEYVLRFTQRGKGAQELGVERQVQGHGACELASAATLADEPTDSHVNHAARGTASHEKRERRAAAHAFLRNTGPEFRDHAQRVCILDVIHYVTLYHVCVRSLGVQSPKDLIPRESAFSDSM